MASIYPIKCIVTHKCVMSARTDTPDRGERSGDTSIVSTAREAESA